MAWASWRAAISVDAAETPSDGPSWPSAPDTGNPGRGRPAEPGKTADGSTSHPKTAKERIHPGAYAASPDTAEPMTPRHAEPPPAPPRPGTQVHELMTPRTWAERQ